MTPLTDLDRQLLTFERQRWRYPGAKEQAVRALFGWSMTRHTQAVVTLLDNPAALVHDPVLVRRLQRLRDQRAARRRGAAA